MSIEFLLCGDDSLPELRVLFLEGSAARIPPVDVQNENEVVFDDRGACLGRDFRCCDEIVGRGDLGS